MIGRRKQVIAANRKWKVRKNKYLPCILTHLFDWLLKEGRVGISSRWESNPHVRCRERAVPNTKARPPPPRGWPPPCREIRKSREAHAYSVDEEFMPPQVSGAASYYRTIYNNLTEAAPEIGGGMFKKRTEKLGDGKWMGLNGLELDGNRTHTHTTWNSVVCHSQNAATLPVGMTARTQRCNSKSFQWNTSSIRCWSGNIDTSVEIGSFWIGTISTHFGDHILMTKNFWYHTIYYFVR